jgi:hypothetical protein
MLVHAEFLFHCCSAFMEEEIVQLLLLLLARCSTTNFLNEDICIQTATGASSLLTQLVLNELLDAAH